MTDYRTGQILVVVYEGYQPSHDHDHNAVMQAVEEQFPDIPPSLTWVVSDWDKDYIHITLHHISDPS